MPRVAKELSAVQVKRLTKPGFHPVGIVAGLLLQVTDTGARSWVLRATIGGKRREMGLGPYPEVTLAGARETAREAREAIRAGIDPIEERKTARDALAASRAKSITFSEAARAFLKSKGREFRNEKHRKQWASTLETYASPVIGKLPVDRVELAHIIKILEPLWQDKTETATRLRGRIESVLAYATASGFRTGDNPARWAGNLEAVLPAPGKLKRVKHHRALPWQEVGGFMVALREREGIAASALEFLILTAARSGEVRGATWDEIDLAAKVWTIPAERMKAQQEHTVPLSSAAIAILKRLPRFEGCPYVFPAPRSGQLSDMTLAAVLRRMEIDATPHGFRSTFRDWCAETTNYPREVAEKALAHTIPSAVERAYRRGDLLTKRTRLMNEWARYCDAPATKGATVTLIRGKKNG